METNALRRCRWERKQLVRRGRRNACRSAFAKLGIQGKTGARHRNFGDFARVAVLLFVVLFPRLIRFFRAYPHGDRRYRWRVFGFGAVTAFARESGGVGVCLFTACRGRVFIFLLRIFEELQEE